MVRNARVECRDDSVLVLQLRCGAQAGWCERVDDTELVSECICIA